MKFLMPLPGDLAQAADVHSHTSVGKFRPNYELIAGGTALVEPERAGNQPRMEARSFDPGSGAFHFDSLEATNMPNPNADNMRSVSMKVIDDRHLASEWRFYENGQLKNTETAQYTRVQ
jgi:hypothetical protein